MVRIRFEGLSVGEISQSSGVFSGNNFPIKWKNEKLSNEGFGSISGDHNKSTRITSAVVDKAVNKSNKG